MVNRPRSKSVTTAMHQLQESILSTSSCIEDAPDPITTASTATPRDHLNQDPDTYMLLHLHYINDCNKGE